MFGCFVCRMAPEGNYDMATAMMKLIEEMMVMSKDMLSILKEIINILSQHQDQLTFLQHRYSKATEESKKSLDKGEHQSRMRCLRCERKHKEANCPMVNRTCFRCHQYGHLVANCQRKVQGATNQSEPSSRSSGFKRSKPEGLSLTYVDALSRRTFLLVAMSIEATTFE